MPTKCISRIFDDDDDDLGFRAPQLLGYSAPITKVGSVHS